MPYYIRLLTPTEKRPDLPRIVKNCALAQQRRVRVTVEGDVFSVVYADDDNEDDSSDEIVIIERLPVIPGSEGEGEIEEFGEEIGDCKPVSAARWLETYLETVRTIYRFQIFEPTHEDWELIHAIKRTISAVARGISQADLEGFSNEEGFHILWQFSDHVTGPWNMAVLRDTQWIPFEMELGDRNQRAAFLRGMVPPGSKVLET